LFDEKTRSQKSHVSFPLMPIQEMTTVYDKDFLGIVLSSSVVDPNPKESEYFCCIRIQKNSDLDSDPGTVVK
jgi:hypothetical protein